MLNLSVRSYLVVALSGTAPIATGAAGADILTLTHGVDGYLGGRDNTMYAEDGSLSNGGGDHLFTGLNGQGQARRSLLRFDLDAAGLPDRIRVTDVRLTLTVNRTNSLSRAVSLHRLFTDWGEGLEDAGGSEGQGTAAGVGSATWTENFHTLSSWGVPGGDFLELPSATAEAPTLGAVTWFGPALVADLQAWADRRAENYGWVLIGDEIGAGASIRFTSNNNDEGEPLAARPTLLIDYEIVPSPSTALLFMMTGALSLRRRRRHQEES